MFFEDSNQSGKRINRTVAPGPFTDFKENYEATKEYHRLTHSIYSREESLSRVLQPLLDDIYDKTGKRFNNPGYLPSEKEDGYEPFSFAVESLSPLLGSELIKINQHIKNSPELSDMVFLTEENLMFKAKQLALEANSNWEDVTGRQDSGASWGELGAMARGEFFDLGRNPLSWPLLVAGSSAKTWLRFLTLNGIYSAGAVAYTRGEIAEWRKEVGLSYTWKQFAAEVTTAGVFGAAFAGVMRGGISGAIKGYKALKKDTGYSNTKADDLIARTEEDMWDLNNNPLKEVLDEQAEHINRTDEAVNFINDNVETLNINDKPVSPIKVPVLEKGLDDTFESGGQYKFNIDDLNVDAKTYQFKSGTDKMGVSDRLKGVKQWDDSKSGVVIVHQRKDGKLYIVDGHQRLNLAKTIRQSDPKQKPRLSGYLYKESDGVSIEEVMVMASSKNIAEGTGSALDVAKILKLSPEQLEKLPPTSSIVIQGRNLNNLSDEARNLVINDIVPAKYAHLVGALENDPVKQLAILKLLHKTNPENVTQAEAIVRQAKEIPFDKQTEQTLFGEEMLVESLFKERAKVLDNALKIIKEDKRIFKTLQRNHDRVKNEGNKLNKKANETRAISDAYALQIIQSNANKKGNLSEALNNSAQRFKTEGSLKNATADFVESVRREISNGNLAGSSVGTLRHNFNPQAESHSISPARSEKNILKDFDDPAKGIGMKNQSKIFAREIDEDIKVKEAFQRDIELRKDLGEKIKKGATEKEIISHPAVTKALSDAEKITPTNNSKNFATEEWWKNRTFIFNGEKIKGINNAMEKMYDNAKKLGWTDEELIPPTNPVLKNKEVHIILGPPASGKSMIANRIAQKTRSMIIDPDEVKKVLPEYKDGIGSNAVHDESNMIAKTIRDTAIRDGFNIIIPTVGHNMSKTSNIIKDFKSKGYKINLINMDVSSSNAFKRMFARFVDTGRLIAPDYLKKVGNLPNITYNKLKGKVDGYAKIDNNQEFPQSPTIRETKNIILQGDEFRLRQGGEGSRPAIQKGSLSAKISSELEEFPVGLRLDEEGKTIPIFKDTKQILSEIDQDKNMLKRLEDCV